MSDQPKQQKRKDYYLVRVSPDGTEYPLPDYGPYATGLLCAQLGKKVAAEKGWRVVGRRISLAPDWRPRAAQMLELSEKMPEGWNLPPIADHFACPGKGDNTVSFYESVENGIIDKRTELAVGRYLERFYPGLTMQEKQRLCATFEERDVLFARTPEQIEWVYENCAASSCATIQYQQRIGKTYFDSPLHPTRIYGAGDLAVAYTKGPSGRVAERTVCHPEKKHFSRMYSDGTNSLRDLLIKKGWQQAGGASFEGARCLRYPVRFQSRWWFVAPHIDDGVGAGGGVVRLRDDGEHLIIDRTGPMIPGNTNGLVKAETDFPLVEPDYSPFINARIANAA